MNFSWHTVCRLPAASLVLVIRVYQQFISPLLGPHCRFQPTCSSYFLQAVHQYGAVRGTFRGLWRICRCNPFSPGGDDPP